MSQAKLIYLMGASGSGKDTLLAHLEQNLNPALYVFAKRYITRPYEIKSQSGVNEQYYYLSKEEFITKIKQDFFAMHWQSHNNYYGLDRQIDTHLAQGKIVILNGSREYLPEALKDYPQLFPIIIKVKPEILEQRLRKRGRESGTDFIERLNGADKKLSANCAELDNSGSIKDAVQNLAVLLISCAFGAEYA